MQQPKNHPTRQLAPPRQRGVVLLFALIALLIMMVGAVALIRSFNSSILNTGSIAFKKDLTNRNEAAISRILTIARQPTMLATTDNSNQNFPAMNYSASILSYNAQGIPNLLLANDGSFNTTGFTNSSNDIDLSSDGVKLRYVIDRQCSIGGPAQSTTCVIPVGGSSNKKGGSSDAPITAENSSIGGAGALTVRPVYRLSIRAIGPKGTLAFYQTTFTL